MSAFGVMLIPDEEGFPTVSSLCAHAYVCSCADRVMPGWKRSRHAHFTSTDGHGPQPQGLLTRHQRQQRRGQLELNEGHRRQQGIPAREPALQRLVHQRRRERRQLLDAGVSSDLCDFRRGRDGAW